MAWEDPHVDRETKNAIQRELRKANNNLYTKKYEKTPKGFLMRLYRNMESRIKGIQKAKFHLYKTRTIMDREAFYSWALNNPIFFELYVDWRRSGYQRKLAPSVDRIDSRKGYTLSNMEWVTMSENSRRGSLAKKGILYKNSYYKYVSRKKAKILNAVLYPKERQNLSVLGK